MIRLFVGLGNPGLKYAKTRHNAGFLCLDELVKDFNAGFASQSRFFGNLAEIEIASKKIILLKPDTFMNASGRSVASVMKYYKIEPKEVLVVHDELDFDVGVLKLKSGGGHGGHNGLRDIVASLGGAKDFKRLRVGIGRPRPGREVANFVLSDFSKTELEQISALYSDFYGYLPLMQSGDFSGAMQKLHSSAV